MSSAVMVVPTTAIPAPVRAATDSRTSVEEVATPETARSRSGAPVMATSRSTVPRQWALFFPVLARTRRILGVSLLDSWLARYW